MADPDRELLEELAAGTKAMAALARDEEVFRAVVDAFRAQDGESMARLLAAHKLSDQCEIVCHWLRSKEAVILCLELAGPPSPELQPPSPEEFAAVVARLTADERALELIADAVQEREVDSWRKLIAEYELERFNHLLCHWVVTIHYRLVCDVVCSPVEVQRPHLIPELRAAGATIGALAEDRETFAAAAKASLAGDCALLGTTLERFTGSCFFICEFFCSWRCFLLCFRLVALYPVAFEGSAIAEERAFALATGKLEKSPLERLAAATLRDDTETLQALVKELGYERFILQFCHWVCFLRCQRFCLCVCPPHSLGVFTKIGALYYDTAIDGGSGLTVGDRRAFYSTLRLNGGLSLVDGAPLIEYRFETIATDATGSPTGTWTAVTPAQIRATNIGSFVRFVGLHLEVIPVTVNDPSGGFNITPSADGWIKVPPMHPTAPMVTGSGWTFVPGSDLINFDTTTLAPTVAAIDETGVGAGDAPAAPLLTDAHYGVRMRIRNQGTSGAGSDAGTCSHIAINNSHYDHVSHHPYWAGGEVSGELALCSLGVAELAAAPCSLLRKTLTVQFSAAHSHLGPVTLRMDGPGGPYTAFTVTPAAPQTPGEQWYGTAELPGFENLPKCAYLLTLSVTAMLTTGDAVPEPVRDQIAFCKG